MPLRTCQLRTTAWTLVTVPPVMKRIQFIVMGLAGETPVEPDSADPVLEADEVSEVLEAEPLPEDAADDMPEPVASFRSKSVLTGKIIGVDRHTFNVRNRETGAAGALG